MWFCNPALVFFSAIDEDDVDVGDDDVDEGDDDTNEDD